MHVQIESAAKIGKSVSIKREKGSGDEEIVVAHLKFSDTWIPREAFDEFLGQPVGWSQMCFFDEGGAPIAHMDIFLPIFVADVTGVIAGPQRNEEIKLNSARLQGVTGSLADKGYRISGELSWEIAGDESSDLEPLLGRVCRINWVVQTSGQQDLLKAA